MPEYQYECPSCGSVDTVWEGMRGSHEVRPCSLCGGVARRVWTVPIASIPSTEPEYNWGLGTYTKGKRSVRDAMSRAEEAGDMRLAEVGNERVRATPRTVHYPTASELGY